MDNLVKYSPIIAPVALVFGLVGLILGIVAFQKSSQLDAVSDIKDANSTISENVAGIQEAVSNLDKKYATLANLQDVIDQTQGGFNSLAEQLSKVRTQARTDTIKIAELEARLGIGDKVSRATASPTGSGTPEPGVLTPAPDGSGAMQYTIKKGDTLGKVAASFGISVDALLQANPGIQPRYLGIGQKMNIPGVNP